MNFPAIAKKTYDLLKSQNAFVEITNFVVYHLKKMSSPLERARFIHHIVDDYNREVFAHPLVKELSPCKAGCASCCHTQVSVTQDEADLLARRVEDGVKVDLKRLEKQMEFGNSSEDFYKLSFDDRKCIFLGEKNLCQVYEDRPSVCRTNSVLGESAQCLTPNSSLRLIKTSQADMAIMGAFLASKANGSLSFMLGQKLLKSKVKKPNLAKKSISIDQEL